MTKYQQFLEKINIISEETFNEIVDEFPNVDIEELDFCYNDFDTVDDVARAFIDVVLKEYNFVYTDEINFDTRTISFEDVDTLEDLELIKQRFSNWTITNYGELKEELIQEEKEDLKAKKHSERMNLISKVIDKVPVEDLKEFCNKYE